MFPDGLLIDQALKFSTEPNSHDSVTYLLFGGGANDMAFPTGLGLLWTPRIQGACAGRSVA